MQLCPNAEIHNTLFKHHLVSQFFLFNYLGHIAKKVSQTNMKYVCRTFLLPLVFPQSDEHQSTVYDCLTLRS